MVKLHGKKNIKKYLVINETLYTFDSLNHISGNN